MKISKYCIKFGDSRWVGEKRIPTGIGLVRRLTTGLTVTSLRDRAHRSYPRQQGASFGRNNSSRLARPKLRVNGNLVDETPTHTHSESVRRARRFSESKPQRSGECQALGSLKSSRTVAHRRRKFVIFFTTLRGPISEPRSFFSSWR